MNVEIVNEIEALARKALKAGETRVAFVLGILCGAIQRGEVEDFAAAVGLFTQEAIFKHTIRQLKKTIAESERDASGFSKN